MIQWHKLSVPTKIVNEMAWMITSLPATKKNTNEATEYVRMFKSRSNRVLFAQPWVRRISSIANTEKTIDRP
jgi:hypothetical protein